MTRAVLCGYYGYGNSGDEALLATLLQMLPAHVSPLVLSGNPQQTEQQYGVKACDRNSPWAVLQALRSSDAFIWGGGSLIQDATSRLSPVYYTGLMGLAQSLGLTTIAWAQGIGPLKRKTTRWLAQQSFSGCQALSVRDQASAAILKHWELSYTLAPDPVWALQPQTHIKLDLPGPRIAVALRSHPQLTSARLACLTQALAALQAQTQTSLLLLPFQPSQDLAIAQTLQAQLPGPSQILTLNHPQVLKGVFQQVDMVIGMRLHALIMAASEGCRCFAISYDPKVTQLMSELNLPGWELEQLPNQAEAMTHTWQDYQQRGQGCLPAQIQTQVSQALKHQTLLHQVLSI